MTVPNITKNRGEMAFILASMISAVLNYMAYPVILKNLSLFDATASINALGIVTTIGGIFASGTVVGLYLHKNHAKDSHLNRLISHSQGYALKQIAIFSILVILLSRYISIFLRLESLALVVLSVLTVCAGTLHSIWIGYFNGAKFFRYSSALLVCNSLLQLIILALLTSSIPNASIPLLSFLAGTILSLVIIFFISRRRLRVALPKIKKGAEYSEASKFSNTALITFIFMWLGQNYDVFLARKLFDNNLWTSFTAVSLLPKIVYFLGFTIIWVLLSKVLESIPSDRFSNLVRYMGLLATALIPPTLIIMICRTEIEKLIGVNALDLPNSSYTLMVIYKMLYAIVTFAICASLLTYEKYTALKYSFVIFIMLSCIYFFSAEFNTALKLAITVLSGSLILYLIWLKKVPINEKFKN